MALNKNELLKTKGEVGALPLNQILSKIIDEINNYDEVIQQHTNKLRHISADENSTTFDGTPIYHGENNELVVTNEKGNITNASNASLEEE